MEVEDGGDGGEVVVGGGDGEDNHMKDGRGMGKDSRGSHEEACNEGVVVVEDGPLGLRGPNEEEHMAKVGQWRSQTRASVSSKARA